MISFSAIFYGLSDASPTTGAFFRESYALPVLALIWLARRKADTRSRSSRWMAAGAGLALGADTVIWHTSIDYIGAGLATLVANVSVVFVALGAWVIFGERPRRATMIAIPVILAGVALVSGVGQGDAFGTDPVRGTLLALLAALFYSGFLLVFRRSNDEQAPAAGPLMEATLGAALALLAFGPFLDGVDFEFSWPGHGWLIALALGSQVAGWLMIGYALPRLPAVETATIILIQPALTMIWAAMVFDERPSPLQIVGAGVVLSGVAFVALVRGRRAARPEPAVV